MGLLSRAIQSPARRVARPIMASARIPSAMASGLVNSNSNGQAKLNSNFNFNLNSNLDSKFQSNSNSNFNFNFNFDRSHCAQRVQVRHFAASPTPPGGPESEEIDPEKEELKQTENNMEKLIDYGSRAAVVGLTTAVLASAEPENPTTYAIAAVLCVCGLRVNAWGLAAIATVMIFGMSFLN